MKSEARFNNLLAATAGDASGGAILAPGLFSLEWWCWERGLGLRVQKSFRPKLMEYLEEVVMPTSFLHSFVGILRDRVGNFQAQGLRVHSVTLPLSKLPFRA